MVVDAGGGRYGRAMDVRTTTVVALAAQVRSGEVTATELAQHALARIDADNGTVNAFVALDRERTLADAAAVDARIAAGQDPGPLAGIPLAVKDTEDAVGYVNTQGSAYFAATRGPATANSILVQRLVDAGCVVVGKTNTPELAWKPDTENRVFGRTRNPWNLEHVAGGSSGGSAAAIAAGMVPLATGSDGGGSLRIPSSCCGLASMKTSLGRVPDGASHAPDWHDLSAKGPMVRRISDLTVALDVVVGPDPRDLRSLPRDVPSWVEAVAGLPAPSKVAWSPNLGYAEVDREVLRVCEAAVQAIADAGVEVVEVDTVFAQDPIDAWLLLCGVYNLRTYAHLRGTPAWDEVDPVLAMIIEGAAAASPDDVVRAEDAGHDLNLELLEVFDRAPLLLAPVMAAEPPAIALGGSGMINGEVDLNWVKLTYGFNMTRSPTASVIAGISAAGLPIGMQVIGSQHRDLEVLRAAGAFEEILGVDEVAPFPG